MIRVFVGVALLAVSWLLGQHYYSPPNLTMWIVAVAAGSLLLGGAIERMPKRRDLVVAVVLLLPAFWWLPWPERVAPGLLIVGLLVELLPLPAVWLKKLGRGAVVAGVVLLVQAVVLAAYAVQTGNSHDLPWPLPTLLAGLANLLGIDAVADGSTLVIHALRRVHRLGATWDLLLDPVMLGFFFGSLAALGLVAWSRLPRGEAWKTWIRWLRILAVAVIVWLPVRAGLLIALYFHRSVRAGDGMPPHEMNQFLSPWVLLLLLAVPVLLAWRFVRLPEDAETEETTEPAAKKPWHEPAAVALVAVAAAIFAVAIGYDPIGTPKSGRVKVVERHSDWEWTTKTYDTKAFGHDSGYNYAAVYDYLGQYFTMSRLLQKDKIDALALADCDVLVVKTPTARWSPEEVAAVHEFVRGGGGLLLIGDHTNVFKSSTFMNDIVRPLGFVFRDDLLFTISDKPYKQLYRLPPVPHPVVQHLPPMDFAVSCSIDPGNSRGRAVIRNTGLFSLPPDYRVDNYHPVPQYRPDMRYGAFIQLWSTRVGQGRVLAFTDSTIFSNFCVYQPGKAELLLGMVDWLNHNNSWGDPRWVLLLLGMIPLAAGLWLGWQRDGWLVLLAGGVCGWVIASMAIATVQNQAMPVPDCQRPMLRVVVDRTTSEVPLAKGAFIEDESGKGYGMLEQWLARLNCYTTRRSGLTALEGEGDVLVAICPNRSVPHEFRDRLVEFVEAGGKLLVFDGPNNNNSTANSLLWPFGLAVRHEQPWQGTLTLTDDWPNTKVDLACQVTGGEVIGRFGQMPVAATTTYGKGRVTAVGFASFFNDKGMGYDGQNTAVWTNNKPSEETLARYEIFFALVRSLIDGKPIVVPASTAPDEAAQ